MEKLRQAQADGNLKREEQLHQQSLKLKGEER
jgi:hypothetical protein